MFMQYNLNVKCLKCVYRSSLRKEVDKTTFGAFVDIDPHLEKISLRSLVCLLVFSINFFLYPLWFNIIGSTFSDRPLNC